jgi:hypothetical protein
MPSSPLSQIADQVRRDTIRHHRQKRKQAQKAGRAFHAKAKMAKAAGNHTKAEFYTHLGNAQEHRGNYHGNVALTYSNVYKQEQGKYNGARTLEGRQKGYYGGAWVHDRPHRGV